MKRLTHREANAVLNALSALRIERDFPDIEARFSEAIKRVVPAENFSFDFFDPQCQQWDYGWLHPKGCIPPEVSAIFGIYFHEHPLVSEFVKTGLSSPRKVSDFITTSKFRRLGIYNEFYRLIGVDKQISVGLPVSPTRILLATSNRNGKDFTESDRLVLAALRPHLISYYRDVQTLAEAQRQQDQMQSALESSRLGLIVLDRKGRVKLLTEQARRWLVKYLSDHMQERNPLPNPVTRWYEHYVQAFYSHDFTLPAPPLTLVRNGSCLRIRLTVNDAAQQIVLILEEDRDHLSLELLESLELTRREAEVMSWVARGKTNREIGALCDISGRTVQKHLEHIFQKLGVETRTAAALYVTERLK